MLKVRALRHRDQTSLTASCAIRSAPVPVVWQRQMPATTIITVTTIIMTMGIAIHMITVIHTITTIIIRRIPTPTIRTALKACVSI